MKMQNAALKWGRPSERAATIEFAVKKFFSESDYTLPEDFRTRIIPLLSDEVCESMTAIDGLVAGFASFAITPAKEYCASGEFMNYVLCNDKYPRYSGPMLELWLSVTESEKGIKIYGGEVVRHPSQPT